jgi:hypothetical protein
MLDFVLAKLDLMLVLYIPGISFRTQLILPDPLKKILPAFKQEGLSKGLPESIVLQT